MHKPLANVKPYFNLGFVFGWLNFRGLGLLRLIPLIRMAPCTHRRLFGFRPLYPLMRTAFADADYNDEGDQFAHTSINYLPLHF